MALIRFRFSTGGLLIILGLLAVPLRAQQGGEGVSIPGLLMEAEDYRQKTPDTEEFAAVTRENTASGFQVVYRLFGKGQLEYEFTLPTAGEYRIWLRYAANNEVRLPLAVNPAGAPQFARIILPGTGTLTGASAWKWAPVHHGPLPRGAQRLVIGAAPLRADCFFITASEQAPTDELLRRALKVKLDPATRALVERPLSPIRPDWLDGARDYRLPAWYEQHRVHLHTRLSLRWHARQPELFLTAATHFRELGAKVIARHIKTGSEGAWWPSAIGEIAPPAKERNLAKEIIGHAHREGLRILVYHRHMEDEGVAQAHPDWISRDAAGKPYVKRGTKVCLNSPYADFLLQRMFELAELGADGFYFDEVHMEKGGCWCDFCKRQFKAETGLDHPAAVNVFDPVWHKLADFTNVSIERVFRTWRQALHARHPELVLMIGSHTWPIMTERHMTHRLFRIADAMKTEFNLPARTPSTQIFPLPPEMKPWAVDAKIALGYTLARDATDGRPPHVWVHGLKDEAAMRFAVAGVVTHGAIANLDIAEATIPNAEFKPAFALGDKVSPYFAGARPVRWAALHFSERARDRHWLEPHEAWRQVLYPLYGAYETLLRERLPAGLITDSQLEEGLLDGYQILFLPAPEALTEAMRGAVERFRKRGGLVVEQPRDWLWHDPNGGAEKAAAAFKQTIAPRLAQAPVRVLGGPAQMHAVTFASGKSGRLTVSLANDFSWVETGSAKEVGQANPPPPCRDVRIVLPGRKTAPRVLEAVTGKSLSAEMTKAGAVIPVPDFDAMAVLVIE
jgi:hypothetical protein